MFFPIKQRGLLEISPKPFPRCRIPLRNTHLSCMIVYAYWATMNIFTKVKGCLQGLSTSVEIELRLGKRYFISSPKDDSVCNIVIFKSWIDDKPTKDWTCCHMMVSQWICGVTCFQTSPIYVYMFIYIYLYIYIIIYLNLLLFLYIHKLYVYICVYIVIYIYIYVWVCDIYIYIER